MRRFSTILLFVAILGCGADFKAYWNIPLTKCTNHGVFFELDKFGIIHNEGNSFFGDKINILYVPGLFPRYSSKNEPINGGIPQLADFGMHRETFYKELNSTLKDAFEGAVVMDFETYQPSFQNSMPAIYREKSIEFMRELHPTWNTSQIWEEAAKSFNETIKPYFETLLTIGKQERPNVMFGYYHYPYCSNYEKPCNKCTEREMHMNDMLKDWFYNNTGALFPSVYTFEKGVFATYRTNVVVTRMVETQRINVNKVPVYPYFWYRFKDSPNFLPKSVVFQILSIVKQFNGNGVVLWGAYSDLDTKRSCLDFKEYVDKTLGPALKCMNALPEDIVEYFRNVLSDELRISDALAQYCEWSEN